ncbi:MAG: hypothetical protein HZB91_06560 [Elusimicrobia bacterium]|nr:hypothetical protein [Elusimicrobiota bacterium]
MISGRRVLAIRRPSLLRDQRNRRFSTQSGMAGLGVASGARALRPVKQAPADS